ncbi:MAG: response regulator [Bdellovibrionales bacterium]|nr:response regulator [Bdellovibrionales bacterium]
MSNFQKHNILVVDDDETLRNAIAFDMKRCGFSVIQAANGTEAFRIVETTEVSLVISDVRMPGGDGLSLLERIRAFNPNIPLVIFVTGFAGASETSCIEKGALKVIPKPFDRQHLISSVFEALRIPVEPPAA